MHLRSLGFEAHRVATIRAALGTAAAPSPPPARPAVARKVVSKKISAAKKTAPAKVAAKAPAKKKVDTPKQIVVASLLRMGKALPGKRKGLEHHIDNHLGRKGDVNAARALVDELERDGLLRIVDNKVEYALPKVDK